MNVLADVGNSKNKIRSKGKRVHRIDNVRYCYDVLVHSYNNKQANKVMNDSLLRTHDHKRNAGGEEWMRLLVLVDPVQYSTGHLCNK